MNIVTPVRILTGHCGSGNAQDPKVIATYSARQKSHAQSSYDRHARHDGLLNCGKPTKVQSSRFSRPILRDILEHVGGAREASRDEWRYVFLGIGIGSIREIMLE